MKALEKTEATVVADVLLYRAEYRRIYTAQGRGSSNSAVIEFKDSAEWRPEVAFGVTGSVIGFVKLWKGITENSAAAPSTSPEFGLGLMAVSRFSFIRYLYSPP